MNGHVLGAEQVPAEDVGIATECEPVRRTGSFSALVPVCFEQTEPRHVRPAVVQRVEVVAEIQQAPEQRGFDRRRARIPSPRRPMLGEGAVQGEGQADIGGEEIEPQRHAARGGNPPQEQRHEREVVPPFACDAPSVPRRQRADLPAPVPRDRDRRPRCEAAEQRVVEDHEPAQDRRHAPPLLGGEVERFRVHFRVRQLGHKVVEEMQPPVGVERHPQAERGHCERVVDRAASGWMAVNDLVLERIVPGDGEPEGGRDDPPRQDFGVEGQQQPAAIDRRRDQPRGELAAERRCARHARFADRARGTG